MTSVDGAVEPQRGVDAVGQQIAGDAAAGTLTSSRHRPCAALRQVLRDGPVLQELGAVVEDPPQPALVDQLLGKVTAGTRR